MMTIIFKDNVKGYYEDYVKYFYGTLKNYFELYPETEMPLIEVIKEEFDENVDKQMNILCGTENTIICSKIDEYLDVIPYDEYEPSKKYLNFAKYMNSVDSVERLNILKHVSSLLKDTEHTCDVCNVCAKIGSLECLKYAHENGYEWDKETSYIIVKEGNVDCLKYAHENGYGWYIGICNITAQCGQLECSKYLRKNGCNCDKDTCSSAAGDLECPKYLHENGCP